MPSHADQVLGSEAQRICRITYRFSDHWRECGRLSFVKNLLINLNLTFFLKDRESAVNNCNDPLDAVGIIAPYLHIHLHQPGRNICRIGEYDYVQYNIGTD